MSYCHIVLDNQILIQFLNQTNLFISIYLNFSSQIMLQICISPSHDAGLQESDLLFLHQETPDEMCQGLIN